MSDRKENIKKNLGITEYPWSSDDENSDTETLFRRPNEESDGSNGANEEQRDLNSPVWEDEQRPRERMGQEQLWAMSNDPNREFRQDQNNSENEENVERFPNVGLHRVIMYKRLRRRDGSTFRHPYVRPVNTPMDLRCNVARVRQGSGPRITLPMLTGSSIVSLVGERAAASSEPQPSTSRGFRNTNASTHQSSNSVIPPNNLFSATRLRSPPPRNPTSPIPSTSTAAIAESPLSPAPFTARSEIMQRTPKAEQPDATNQPITIHDEPTQSPVPVGADVHKDLTGGETDNVNGRGLKVPAEVVPEPQVEAVASNQENLPEFVMDAVLEHSDVALGSTEQPRIKKRRQAELHSSETDTVKRFNQCLLRLLECPVCLECMEPPIAQCRRGHLVCSRCRARISSCPVCRTAFSSVRNRAMEGVAELLRYPCRHGCGRWGRLRARGSHEASCTARTYRCPAHPCPSGAPLPLPKLLEHLQKAHGNLMRTGRTHKFSMKMNTKQHDTWLVVADEDLFSMCIDVDIRSWGIVVYVAYVGPKYKARNYNYQVTVIGQNNERRLTYSRVTHSDLESSPLNVSRQDCFHLSLDQALNFLRVKSKNCEPDKFLDFIVQINKRETIEIHSGDESA